MIMVPTVLHCIPCPWAIWTVWSTAIKELMEKNSPTKEFAMKVIDIVREKDGKFDRYIFSGVPENTEIHVIQPVKVKIRDNKLEIVGTIYKPGMQSASGKRWTLLASKQLATVLKADSDLISSNGANNIFIILGGTVKESPHLIELNEKTPSKIIRFIDNGLSKPDLEGEKQKHRSYKIPYMDAEFGDMDIINVLNVRPQKGNNISILKTFPRVQPPSKESHLSPSSASTSSVSTVPARTKSKRNVSSTALSPTTSSLKDHQPVRTNGINDSSLSPELTTSSKPATPKRPNLRAEANVLPGGFFPSETNVDSPHHQDNEVEMPQVHDLPVSKRRKINYKKQNYNYVYSKLQELHDKLMTENVRGATLLSTLMYRNIFAVVDEVQRAPEEAEFTFVDDQNEPAKYFILVSDETRSNVLVRLCTQARKGVHPNIHHKVGPKMKTTDIIRIHRATVQWEEERNTGVRQMVISIPTHLDYVLFNFDSNINAPIVDRRLASNTPAIRDGTTERVKNLRQFIINRQNDCTAAALQNESVPGGAAIEHMELDDDSDTPPSSMINGPTTCEPGQNVVDSNSESDHFEDAVEDPDLELAGTVGASKNVQNSKDAPAHQDDGLCSSEELFVVLEGGSLPSSGQRTSSDSHDNVNQNIINNTQTQNSIDTYEGNSTPYTDSPEYSVSQAVLFLRLGSFPKKLKDITGNESEPFHLSVKICNLVETDDDLLIIRISDGTIPKVKIKQLIPPDLDLIRGTSNSSNIKQPFADLVLLNISDSPGVRNRVMAGRATTKSFVFTHVQAESVTDSDEIELKVEASIAHARWEEVHE